MNTADKILGLLEATDQNGPDMTHALKNIGGDMKTGIKKISQFFRDQGKMEGFQIGKGVGEKNGFLKGSIITLCSVAIVEGGIYLYGKYREKKELQAALKAQEEAGQEILVAIEETYDTEEPSNLQQQVVDADDQTRQEETI